MKTHTATIEDERVASDELIKQLVAASFAAQAIEQSLDRVRHRIEKTSDRRAMKIAILDCTLHSTTLVSRLAQMLIQLASEY